MELSARDAYLETQVNTATPQRLRLMLIEGALRQAQLAKTAWQESRPAGAAAALIGCRDIVVELLSGISPGDTPLVRQTLGIYAYLYSSLTELQQSRDAHELAGIIRVLEEEQQTWQEVCLALPHRVDTRAAVEERAPPRVGQALQPSYGGPAASSAPIASMSIEA
ncbi:MAG TPA: flagellar export chaperone FliS [Pirellulaceae bacterium]|nr:flagellar export chaperone FliS [Pirellulaceae bacterium]